MFSQEPVHQLLVQHQAPAGTLGGDGGGELRLVAVQGGGPEEVPRLQHADGQAPLCHLKPARQHHPQAAAEVPGAVHHPGVKPDQTGPLQLRQGAEQRPVRLPEQRAAGQQSEFLLCEGQNDHL